MERSSIRQAAVVFLPALFVPLLLHLLSLQRAPPPRRLIVGVLSARDHLSERQAIRQTWGSALQGLPDVEMKFVLGDQDCSIPPADRVSPYGCEVWHLKKRDWESSKLKQFFKSHYSQYKKNLRSLDECYIGLGFRALHPVIIEKFMVQREILKGSNNTVVIFSDPEEVIEQVVLSHSVCHEEGDLCSIKLSSLLRLPKGFEGELRLFSLDEKEELCGEELYDFHDTKKWVCDWNNSSILEYKFLRTRKNTLIKWHKSSCPLVSAKFTIPDKSALKEHKETQAERAEEWKQHLADLQLKLEEEQNHHHDLLILPHLDVYNNLPYKVMAYLSWTAYKQNSSYVMKVDDDTFVNVNLLNMLTEVQREEDQVWWSLFHHRRSVPAYGKWADFTYPSLTYPAFPAGSGYIMTKSLVRAVVDAQHHLIPHGGEDVSMGIWVSSVSAGARHVEVPCWLPHLDCSENVLVPQLSVQQMVEVWHNQTNII
ncbi:hypothetical protein O3P69_004422 [Scylla paramamosain]|uniref:Hexosyltransferase n=1 Tax=Scylla paramamosain TaxID=85552 RepID=A0AAW0UEH1_SCYPA